MTLPSEENGAQSQDDIAAAARTAHVAKVTEFLLGNSAIYGTFLKTIKLEGVQRGAVTTSLVLEAQHLNSKGGLHGAVSATIIDFTTGLAVASWDLRDRTGASVDMHVSYLSSARAGDTVEIVSTAERVGGSLAFVTVRIDKLLADGTRKPVTLGQHTKFVKGTEKMYMSSSQEAIAEA